MPATIEELRFLCQGVKRRESTFTVGIGASHHRSESRELAVKGDKEEIRLCQEDLMCDLKIVQVL
jgi:hypothetical protein